MNEHKGLPILSFESQDEFIDWLNGNYEEKSPYWVRLIKKSSLKKGISYVEAREAAIMFGWIDGLANRLDEDYYLVRFTHRRQKSVWSKINVAIVQDLNDRGVMRAEGLKEVANAKLDGRWEKAY